MVNTYLKCFKRILTLVQTYLYLEQWSLAEVYGLYFLMKVVKIHRQATLNYL